MEVETAREIAHEFDLVEVELDACPYSFYDVPIRQLIAAIGRGGCGPGDSGDYLVPDRIYFLNVKPACCLHDWGYHWCADKAQRYKVDRAFLDNMLTLIDKQSVWWLKWLRRRRALTYYDAVRVGGRKDG